jgi:hypothetical protein
MEQDFQYFSKLYKDDKISTIAESEKGLKYLKIKSFDRKIYTTEFSKLIGYDLSDISSRQHLEKLFMQNPDGEIIDNFIKTKSAEIRRERGVSALSIENSLKSIEKLDTGGIYQGGLENTLIKKFVKDENNLSILFKQLESGSVNNIVNNYLIWSWYNNWTSIYIEDFFAEHKNVIQAIGQVKKIDFFLNNVPFDLKVTYFPEGFIKNKRREAGIGNELTLLKQFARREGIEINSELGESKLLEDLWVTIQNYHKQNGQNLLNEMSTFRLNLYEHVKEYPEELIVWLYENQGERRFDAANRLFLILYNRFNFFESWKLKRKFTELKKEIHLSLDQLANKKVQEIEFNFSGSSYKTKSEIIFIEN